MASAEIFVAGTAAAPRARARGLILDGLPWLLVALAAIQVAAGLALAALNGLDGRGLVADFFVAVAVAALSFATIGAVIARHHPGNAIGWLLCLAGAGNGAFTWLGQYARYALVTAPGALPGGELAFWFNLWTWPLIDGLLLLLLPLLFPGGTLLSARWRPLAWLGALAVALLALSLAFGPNTDNFLPQVPNPFLLPGALGPLRVCGTIGTGLLPFCLLGAFASLIVRFRRARGDEREQLKWFAGGAGLLIAGFAGGVIVFLLGLTPDGFASGALQACAFPWLPLATGVAILRYRLYDIDLIINRALVYGALTVSIVAIYVASVGYLAALFRANGSPLVALVATGLVAALFQPLREWLQRGVNRLLYGERDEPYAILARLGQRLGATISPEATLAALVDGVAGALRLPYAAIWLIDGETLRLGAAHGAITPAQALADAAAIAALRHAPEGVTRAALPPTGRFAATLAATGAELAFPLVHGGALVGTLCLAPRSAGEGFSGADRRLLRDLASHAGMAAQTVQLTVALRASLAELRRSREQLVVAQEEERRRLQRDLHDDLGPTLASMRLRLEACLDEAQEVAPRLMRSLERLHDLVGGAGADIRRLVYDLRPPALDQLGLLAALREYVERFGTEAGIGASFAAEETVAIPAAAEVAIFRVVQEALVNVQKHADAARVAVALAERDGWLLLEIRDDGVGLPAAPHAGTGLGSMRERVDLLGGSLTVSGWPAGGTTVQARIPLGGTTT